MTHILTPYPPSGKTCHLHASNAGDIARARAWRPSSLEQTVAAALSAVPGIAWERDYEVRYGEQTLVVDFVVQTGHRRIAIEVQAECIPRDRGKQQRARTGKIKIGTGPLRCCFDELVFIDECDIASPGLANRLARLLGQGKAVGH